MQGQLLDPMVLVGTFQLSILWFCDEFGFQSVAVHKSHSSRVASQDSLINATVPAHGKLGRVPARLPHGHGLTRRLLLSLGPPAPARLRWAQAQSQSQPGGEGPDGSAGATSLLQQRQPRAHGTGLVQTVLE